MAERVAVFWRERVQEVWEALREALSEGVVVASRGSVAVGVSVRRAVAEGVGVPVGVGGRDRERVGE